MFQMPSHLPNHKDSMNQWFTINEIIIEIYQLANEVPISQFRQKVFETINQIIPFDSAFWINSVPENTFLSEDTIFLYQQPQSMLESYLDFREQDPTYFQSTNNPSVTVNFQDYVPIKKRVHTPIIHGCLKPFNIEHLIATAIPEKNSDFIHGISLFRADPLHSFSRKEMYIKQIITPHLFEAYKIAILFAFKSKCTDIQSASRLMAVINKHGHILHATLAFNRRVPFFSMTLENPPLFLNKLTDLGEFEQNGLRFLVSSLTEGLYFINVIEPGIEALLTEAEQRVADLLAQGKTYKEIARLLYISPNTVSNHTHQIYSKLNIRNKTELTWLFKNNSTFRNNPA